MANTNEEKSYLPILIDLSNFHPIVIGGGNLAVQKIKNLLKFGSKPLVLSDEINDEMKSIIQENDLEYREKKYESGDCKGFNLVFSAIDNPEVDQIIEKECSEAGILVNFADIPKICNFIMPGTIKHGPLTVSVATQGKAPFFSRYMRKKIDSNLPENINNISEFAAIFREILVKDPRYKNEMERKKLVKRFTDTDWDGLITHLGYDSALEHVKELFDH